jgi:predicted chitinase
MITLDIMVVAFAKLPRDTAKNYVPLLNAAMDRFDINTPRRIACFLAQIGHESLDLTHFEEMSSGRAYDPDVNPRLAAMLGNLKVGDGPRYKGRGAIQTTGLKNVTRVSHVLGIDFIRSPELLATPDCAFLAAGVFWADNFLNGHADRDDFDGITLRINGGFNGKPDRDRRWGICKRLLGVSDVTASA